MSTQFRRGTLFEELLIFPQINAGIRPAINVRPLLFFLLAFVWQAAVSFR